MQRAVAIFRQYGWLDNHRAAECQDALQELDGEDSDEWYGDA